jgi:hypothetical protein
LFGCAKPHGTTAQNKFGPALAGVFGHLAGTVENRWRRPKHSDLSFNQINKLTGENGKRLLGRGTIMTLLNLNGVLPRGAIFGIQRS